MKRDDVSELLKNLPRQEASSGFTERVIARLDAPSRRGVGRAWVLAAACALIAGLSLGAVAWREHAERRAAAERLEQRRVEIMRNEYRALERELQELRSLASEAQPVLELGGTENVDFVFDLRRHAEERGRARARPTSHSTR